MGRWGRKRRGGGYDYGDNGHYYGYDAVCKFCGGAHQTRHCGRAKKARHSSLGASNKNKCNDDDRSLFERMTVEELKGECRKLGLAVSGRKSELVARIHGYRPKSAAERAGVQVTRCTVGNENDAISSGNGSNGNRNQDVSALFDVEDDDANDAEMAKAAAAFELMSQGTVGSAQLSGGIPSFKPSSPAAVPVTDSKKSPSCASGGNPSTTMTTLSQLSQSSSVRGIGVGGDPTVRVGAVVVPPLAKAAAGSGSSSSNQLTEEQRERMRRMKDEARRRRELRCANVVAVAAAIVAPTPIASGAAHAGVGSGDAMLGGSHRKTPLDEGVKNVNQNGGAQDPSESGGRGPARKKTKGVTNSGGLEVFNPYARRREVKRDESRPDNSILNPYHDDSGGLLGCGNASDDQPTLTVEDLPPLPKDAPPVREETLGRLSEQQLAVVMAARPPHAGAAKDDGEASSTTKTRDNSADAEGGEDAAPKELFPVHHMVRVNAAAGTGKTTTLLHLASRLVDLGHADVRYVTYSKASARDAQERIRGTLDEDRRGCVNASTLHSCAYTLLKAEADGDDDDDDSGGGSRKPLEETEFKRWIDGIWGKRIDEYLSRAVLHQQDILEKKDELHKLDGKVKLLREKALQLVCKTFTNFARKGMSLERFKDRRNRSRHHYSIGKSGPDSEFGPDGAARKLGFPESYAQPGSYEFHADLCVEIWEYAHENPNAVRTYDMDVKRAQLDGLRIPCTALLVDECQDMDEVQVSWIVDQHRKFGTHVYFVGDSAQCIYGFRGARSSNVMKLNCVDLKLTKSWRFGPTIAKVANVPLFVKEVSPQTTQNHGNGRVWIPYRVEGARLDGEEDDDDGGGGRITTSSLLTNWRERGPITLIGRTNAGLMIKAMDLLGLAGLKNPSDEEVEEEGVGSDVEDALATAGSARVATAGGMPKFHVISGAGETSGRGRWRRVILQVRHL